jgi:hypothetical protein
VLAVAVRATTQLLHFDAPEWASWADTKFIDPAEQRLVDRQRAEGSSFCRSKLALLIELDRFRDRAAFGWAWFWPTGEHLRARGLTRRWLFGRRELAVA